MSYYEKLLEEIEKAKAEKPYIQPIYLQHGQRLDSEHDSIKSAEKRARSLIKHYGSNHFQIKIGFRNGGDSRVIIIYHEQHKLVEAKPDAKV